MRAQFSGGYPSGRVRSAFHQVLAEAFPGSGKILLAKIERLADDRFANRNARSRFALDVDIRLMIQNAADLVSGAVAVGRFDDDLAAAKLEEARARLTKAQRQLAEALKFRTSARALLHDRYNDWEFDWLTDEVRCPLDYIYSEKSGPS